MKPFTRTDIATRRVVRVETVNAVDVVDAMHRFNNGEGRLVREHIGKPLQQVSDLCEEGPSTVQCDSGEACGLTIVMEGGVIQTVVSKNPRLVGCTVQVVDYDDEDDDSRAIVVQSDGREIAATVWELDIEASEIEVKS